MDNPLSPAHSLRPVIMIRFRPSWHKCRSGALGRARTPASSSLFLPCHVYFCFHSRRLATAVNCVQIIVCQALRLSAASHFHWWIRVRTAVLVPAGDGVPPEAPRGSRCPAAASADPVSGLPRGLAVPFPSFRILLLAGPLGDRRTHSPLEERGDCAHGGEGGRLQARAVGRRWRLSLLRPPARPPRPWPWTGHWTACFNGLGGRRLEGWGGRALCVCISNCVICWCNYPFIYLATKRDGQIYWYNERDLDGYIYRIKKLIDRLR